MNSVIVNWQMMSADVAKTFRNIGDERAILERILIPAVNEVVKAEGQARAQELLSQTITPKVLALEFLKKWNGQMPQYIGSSNSSVMLVGPFFQMGRFFDDKDDLPGVGRVQASYWYKKDLIFI